jgi:hypothetical protein
LNRATSTKETIGAETGAVDDRSAHSVGKGNPALVRARLQQSADAIDDSGNSAFFGKGRVNAARAVGLQ